MSVASGRAGSKNITKSLIPFDVEGDLREEGGVLMGNQVAFQNRLSDRWLVICFHGLLVCMFLVLLVGCEKKEAAPPPSPPAVKVVDVIQQDVPLYSEWVAQLNGDTNAEIVPKVQGYLLTKNYQEGFFVAKGQLLFEIDPRPFQASMDQSKAQLAVAKAELSKA